MEWRTVDKTAYGPGPWQEEPDKKQWQDKVTGLPCLIVRGPMGNLCGYVGVPKGHKLHGVNYSDAPDFEVHGGLTFADECQDSKFGPSRGICHVAQGQDKVWWFGFDCGHYMDFSPGLRSQLRGYGHGGDLGETYRDLAYVAGQVTHLAKQLAAVQP